MRGPAAGAAEKIRGMIGDVDVGANAGTQAFKDYLFKELQLPVLKTTAKNAEAADDQTLTMLAEWCAENRPKLVPLFELVQEYRRWSKLKTTYIDGYLRFVNPATGRIHPDLLPLATETGRFAARNPNMQNCPRKTNDPVGIRALSSRPRDTFSFPAIFLRSSFAWVRSTAAIRKCWKPTARAATFTRPRPASFSAFPTIRL